MKYRLKDGINFNLVNKKSIMKFDFDLSDYYNKETRIFEFPKGYVAFSLMSDIFNSFLFPLDLIEKVSDEKMDIEELAFKDRKTLANLNSIDLLDIIEFLQNDRKQWINQFTQTHNESVDIRKENLELKEKLLVTQTNEETFRLEMEDITKILGLDEDTIFDDVKTYVRSLKDTMFEKEQLKKQLNKANDELYTLKNKYNIRLLNQISENIEPDCEDYYLAEIETKANKYDLI